MTAIGFQSALARMMVDVEFREAFRQDARFDPGDVTHIERDRLGSVANDPGLDITITLYHAWRLTKVLSLMPLTCRALGEERVADHLRTFWAANPARSLYFVGECLAFCEHLESAIDARDETVVRDALTYERARLEMRREIAHGAAEARRTVRLTHEPSALVNRLTTRQPADDVQCGRYELAGRLTSGNDERWEVVGIPQEPSPDPATGGVEWQTIGSRRTTTLLSAKKSRNSRRSPAGRSTGTATS